ncbi:ligand-binding sensor domain-containing protein [Snuella lapsa]|uniref:HTH araC/xylS-type domain-containing protein n=1 Tax=Snuella lapsa TaxID=870481 RepID=A0ABP6YNR1_9FLAO
MLRNSIAQFLVFLSISLSLFSQDYKFRHITTVDGLSHNEVRKIVKDTEGYLWFGTQNGLNRFDGYRFEIFKHIPEDSTTIVGDKIYALNTSKGKLWVGTTNGLCIINTKSLKVVATPEIFSLITNEVLQLYNDGLSMWVCTGAKNYRVDLETLSVRTCLDRYKIVCVSKGLGGHFWIGTNKGLLKYNGQTDTIIKSYDLGEFNGHKLNQIVTNDYGEIWITIGDKLFRYQSERDRFIPIYESRSLNAIAENEEGLLFVGSYGNGLIVYRRDLGNFSTMVSNPEKINSLSSNDVYDVFVDNENILWVGTQEGLDYYDFTRDRFKSLLHVPGKNNSLRNSFVQSICGISKDTLWVGTREGVDEVVFTNDYLEASINPVESRVTKLGVLKNKYIGCIYQDSKNRIWIGTAADGLFLFKKEAKRLYNYTNRGDHASSISGNAINTILEDNHGRMWFGTNKGLSLLNEKENSVNTFENFTYFINKGKREDIKDVFTVFQDSKDRIWIGMYTRGVALLQETDETRSFIGFRHDNSNPKTLSDDEVFVAFEDSKQRMWFGTSKGGINILREDTTNIDVVSNYFFDSYTEKDGLSDNEVNAILEDSLGYLWIATNKGISKFDASGEHFFNYTTYDGVLKGKFRKNARWKAPDGTIFFGGTAGINYFNPIKINTNKVIPSPRFSRFKIDNETVKVGQEFDGSIIMDSPLESGVQITLPFKDNRFEVEFTALSYASAFRNKYLYKLEGIDSLWHEVSGENPQASYSLLPSGKYRLYVKVSNNDDVWNDTPIYLDIYVKSDVLNSVAFKLSMAVLLLFLIVLILFKRRNNNNRQKVKKAKSNDLEMDLDVKEKIAELEAMMKSEKLYLDPDLRLNKLADRIDISANYLSTLLNDYVGENFYDYINYYRVEEVKKRLLDPVYQNQTISSIGGDCGFNSKSAFNRIFKNFTGKTPSQYQKQASRV